jgi:predicted  nucleic acid-binding Zn-ribbon protein
MTNPSFHLFQLQKIDTRLDVLTRRLHEIDRIRNDNSSRIEIEKSLEASNGDYTMQKKNYDAIEEKVRTKKLKIEQSESSLYGGLVKNPKELQDLQTEIIFLKHSVSSLEDEQLEQMVEMEATEMQIAKIEDVLKAFDAKIAVEFSALFAEEANKKIEKEKLLEERKVVIGQVNPEFEITYQALRKTKNGIAVAAIEEGSCQVCGSTLTPAECQTAKSPSYMATCSSCGRILYAG